MSSTEASGDTVGHLRKAVLLGMVGLMGLRCTTPTQVPPPNIALIILDTLRADHLGAYGYAKGTSAALDDFSRKGTLFENAYAQASWTKPSVASILTSRYPTAHQALAGRAIDEGTPLTIDALHDELFTLPEALQDLGYKTGCVQTNANIQKQYGFAQGCGYYQYMPPDSTAAAVTRQSVAWLKTVHDEPFFLYSHYIDPHMPYTPLPPFDHLYTEARATLKETYNSDQYRSIYDNVVGARLGLNSLQLELVPSPTQLRHWSGLYDGEVAYMDLNLAGLLHQLLATPNTWIIVVADHGEQFMDHGSMGHGQALYQELIRVPMIVVGPGVPARRVMHEPVALIDIFPTLADALGKLTSYPQLQGRSFLAQVRGEAGATAGSPREVYSEVDDSHAVHARPLRTIIFGDLKLTDNEFRKDKELYDLARDPGEKHGLRGVDPSTVRSMMSTMEARRKADLELAAELPPAERVQMDTETLRQLKSLGYIR